MPVQPQHGAAAEESITELLGMVSKGDPSAAGRLAPLIYGELRQIAARYMRRERHDHTLEPTGLVNEAYARLPNAGFSWQGRSHFFAVASQQMRRILVDYARARRAGKRGGGNRKGHSDRCFRRVPRPGPRPPRP